MEVTNPDYFYEPVRVDINAKGKIRARKVNNVQPSQVNRDSVISDFFILWFKIFIGYTSYLSSTSKAVWQTGVLPKEGRMESYWHANEPNDTGILYELKILLLTEV